MLTYSVDFLTQDMRYSDHKEMIGSLSGIIEASRKTSSLPPLDRSTGSPDSLRSETSSESPDSITDMLLSLQKQADVISDVTRAETQKPGHSYIALISMAILNSKGKKMVLGEIYEFIMKKFPYYNNQEKAWRNSIRHNLSINECFIKNGRADNGKGNYWSIHPACVEDFAKGDFRRRHARRRARKGTKTVDRQHFLDTQNRYNTGYVPMTSSSFGYQPMTSSPVSYSPIASWFFGNDFVTRSSTVYHPMTSSPGYPRTVSGRVNHINTTPPFMYEPVMSHTVGVSSHQPATPQPIPMWTMNTNLDHGHSLRQEKHHRDYQITGARRYVMTDIE